MAKPFDAKSKMSLPANLSDRNKALERKKELLERLKKPKNKVRPSIDTTPVHDVPAPLGVESFVQEKPVEIERFGKANVAVYKDDDSSPCTPSSSLELLVNLYLAAAKTRACQVVLMWPVPLRVLSIVHVLATLERWAIGDKLGVRGLLYPTKTNAFQPLNHLYLRRTDILRHAKGFVELQGADKSHIKRLMHEKDPFLFSLENLKAEEKELFNPSMGELIPHFLAGPVWQNWESCRPHLLQHITAKLERRSQKKALGSNCEIIGSPSSAPDALFALDGRLSRDDLRKSLKALKKVGAPEVVLVNATRQIRKESNGWRGALVKFCMMLEEVFGKDRPGVLLVTDDPRVAFKVKDDLWKANKERPRDQQWHRPDVYSIAAVPSTVKHDSLVTPGQHEIRAPQPREFDLEIVDGEAAKVVNAFYRLAGAVVGGIEEAQPLWQAGAYLSKLAALPCGVSTIVEWLSEIGINERTRAAYSWLTFHASLVSFDRQAEDDLDRQALHECMAQGSQLYANYRTGTPLAHRLASLVGGIAGKHHKPVTVVFTSPVYRRLAERYLSSYSDYPNGLVYGDFSSKVGLISSSQLEGKLEGLNGCQLIFSGLDEEGLRLLVTDNRIQAHTKILITQHTGQGLRGLLRPLVSEFDAFRSFKPRIESILRQVEYLPVVNGLSALRDFELPTFKIELSADIEANNETDDPEAWQILLDTGTILHRRPSHDVYVYDPASAHSTDRGFRCSKVQNLTSGDKLFVMSSELRELVEVVLKEAGVPIEHDKSFESPLREYHKSIENALNRHFPGKSLLEQARKLRAAILSANPTLIKGFPAEASVRYWVDLGSSSETIFDRLRTQAPMKEAHFKAFATALGFSPLITAIYWQGVIMAVRNARRVDGRHVSDMYAHMLLQPESAMVHSNIKRSTLQMLFVKARENVVTVDAVICPTEQGRTDEPSCTSHTTFKSPNFA